MTSTPWRPSPLVTEILAVWGPLKPIMAAFLHMIATGVVIFNSARLVRKGEGMEQKGPVAAPAQTGQQRPAPVPALAG